MRAHRSPLLRATDWTELPGARAGMPSGRPAAWDAYRQALRDITENAVPLAGDADFVAWPDWPVPPAE
ncbi:phage tail assembly chaperone [Teichococcus rhizosphaerae]|uniref:phage tail assembly chaperone n=1 Tax=Teichococcus rhizosphaerae TaxID=1335062 RepID=UPI003462ABFF